MKLRYLLIHLRSRIGGVCINPFNSNEIFICTGYADGVLRSGWSPNWAHINPLTTAGIFRSRDYGETWEDISLGFIEHFEKGGWCREMAINPLNPDEICTATTNGIFMTHNATSTNVNWRKAFNGMAGNHDFRGIIYKPNDSNTIYASGTNIYRSINGGTTWDQITGNNFRLNLESMPDSFRVIRINITVTPAAPERLYAYIEGTKTDKNKTTEGGIIALFRNEKWEILETRWPSGLTYFDETWVAIAASPVDSNTLYYGNTRVLGSENIAKTPFGLCSPYNGNGFHADVHDLKFEPNVPNPKLFCGNHGGVSVKSFPNPGNAGWEYKNEGLEVSTLWGFDDSELDPRKAIVATQDNGTIVYYDTLGCNWHYIRGGDGYTARFDDRNPNIAYYSAGDKSLYRFDFSTFKSTNETGLIPKEPTHKKDRVITVKTFPIYSSPGDGDLVFGFTELFRKKINFPDYRMPSDSVWEIISDLRKWEHQGWRRQIIEIGTSKSNPDIMYVVTAGQNNPAGSDWQLKSALYKTRDINSPVMSDGKKFIQLYYPGQLFDDDTLAIITGIAVDPKNADRVWISYTGLPGRFKVWRSENGGQTWLDADPGGVFKINPVNAIAYIENSSDRLIIGTDRGLFTRDRFSLWEQIENFPGVRVTEININYGLNKIRVATFGRGLWESFLKEN